MKRYVSLVGCCCLLLWVVTACAPKQAAPPELSAAGYAVSLHTAPERIWMTPPISNVTGNYLGFGEVVVHVRDAQGQPVDGVPVAFQLEPAWADHTSLTPQQATTQNGMARAIVKPGRIGVFHIMARVDDVTETVSFVVENQKTNTTAFPNLIGLPYPPY